MKWLNYFLFLLVATAYSQDSIQAILVNQFPLEVSKIIGVDNFGTQYYINDNVFYKKDNSKTINYSNLLLGEIASINTYNPLKMVVFYKNFNTVIILDNRLSVVFRIDFNTVQPYKNVSHVSLGNDNTIWVFNQDIQQLELYDYKSKQVRATTLPINSNVLDLKSNYNYCWLLTKEYLYKYNYFGSLLFKIKNDGYDAITEKNDDIILKQGNQLFFFDDKSKNIIPIKTPELLIKQFLVTTETVYIYDTQILYEFHLKN